MYFFIFVSTKIQGASMLGVIVTSVHAWWGANGGGL